MRVTVAILTATGESRDKLIIPNDKVLDEHNPLSNSAYEDAHLDAYMRSKVTKKGDYRSWTRWGPWSCGDGSSVVMWGYTTGTAKHVTPWCIDGDDVELFDDAMVARFAGEEEDPLLPNLQDITSEHVECIREMCPGLLSLDAPVPPPTNVTTAAGNNSDKSTNSGAAASKSPASSPPLIIDSGHHDDDASEDVDSGTYIDPDELLCYEKYTYPRHVKWAFPNTDAVAVGDR